MSLGAGLVFFLSMRGRLLTLVGVEMDCQELLDVVHKYLEARRESFRFRGMGPEPNREAHMRLAQEASERYDELVEVTERMRRINKADESDEWRIINDSWWELVDGEWVDRGPVRTGPCGCEDDDG